MKKVLVVGSINMDYTVYVNEFPLPGETILGSSRFIQPGGKGENQAVALAKSNKVICNFIGAIGKDSDGNKIKEVLKEYKVNAFLKEFDDVETGNATIMVDKESENQIVIIKGANGEIKPEDIDVKLIEDCDYVVLQNEIPEEVNSFVIKYAKKCGKVVVYNPAPYRDIKDNLWNYIDFFIPNKIELFRYTGIEDPLEGSKQLLSKGVKNVLVTLGTRGSMLINNEETINVDAFKVDAIDTVAAGDTFVGYFVASLASGYSIKESMTNASKASSITVTRKGSVISIPYGKEVF